MYLHKDYLHSAVFLKCYGTLTFLKLIHIKYILEGKFTRKQKLCMTISAICVIFFLLCAMASFILIISRDKVNQMVNLFISFTIKYIKQKFYLKETVINTVCVNYSNNFTRLKQFSTTNFFIFQFF